MISSSRCSKARLPLSLALTPPMPPRPPPSSPALPAMALLTPLALPGSSSTHKVAGEPAALDVAAAGCIRHAGCIGWHHVAGSIKEVMVVGQQPSPEVLGHLSLDYGDTSQQSRREEPPRLQTRTAAVCRYSCSELQPHLPPVAPHCLRNSCLFQQIGHRCCGLHYGGILAVSCVCNTRSKREQQHEGCSAASCPHTSGISWLAAQIEVCCRPRAQMLGQLQQAVLLREDCCTTEMQSWLFSEDLVVQLPARCFVSPTTVSKSRGPRPTAFRYNRARQHIATKQCAFKSGNMLYTTATQLFTPLFASTQG